MIDQNLTLTSKIENNDKSNKQQNPDVDKTLWEQKIGVKFFRKINMCSKVVILVQKQYVNFQMLLTISSQVTFGYNSDDIMVTNYQLS